MEQPKKSLEMDNPRVTICLASHESEQFIEPVLDSIRSQTYPHFRCIISDDGSRDNTLKICERIADEDPRFILQAHQERLGWLENMNRMLSQDLGEYFVFVSHDDILRPRYLEMLMTALLANPKASVAFSDAEIFWTDPPHRTVLFCDYSLGEMSVVERIRPVAISKGNHNWFLAYHGVVRNSSLKFKRELKRNLMGEFAADKPWTIGLAISGQFVRVPEVLWRKGYRKESVSQKWSYSSWCVGAVHLSAFRLIWSSYLPIKDCLAISYYLFYGYARMVWWDIQCLFRKPT